MTGKARPRTLFLISGVWFTIALLWTWIAHGWLMGSEHQAWSMVTVLVFLVYLVLAIGWLVPLLTGLIRLISPSLMPGKHFR